MTATQTRIDTQMWVFLFVDESCVEFYFAVRKRHLGNASLDIEEHGVGLLASATQTRIDTLMWFFFLWMCPFNDRFVCGCAGLRKTYNYPSGRALGRLLWHRNKEHSWSVDQYIERPRMAIF